MPLSVPLKTSRTQTTGVIRFAGPSAAEQKATQDVHESIRSATPRSSASIERPHEKEGIVTDASVDGFVQLWGLKKEKHTEAVKFVSSLTKRIRTVVMDSFDEEAMVSDVVAAYKITGLEYCSLRNNENMCGLLIHRFREEVLAAVGCVNEKHLLPEDVTVKIGCGAISPVPTILELSVHPPVEIPAAAVKAQLEKLAMPVLSELFTKVLTRLTHGAALTVEIKTAPQLEDGNTWRKFLSFVRSAWMRELKQHNAVGIYLKRLPEGVQMKLMAHFEPSQVNDTDVMAYLQATFPFDLPPSLTCPVAPMHLATGAGWGHNAKKDSVLLEHKAPVEMEMRTPHAVIRSARENARQRELKHWDTKGKQVVSHRATEPVISFHNGPSGRVVEERGRCREIVEHPCVRNPGPENYNVEPIKPACMVPPGFAHERRFKNSAFATELDHIGPNGVVYSTNAHPLSPAYPYEAVPPNLKSEDSIADTLSNSVSQPQASEQYEEESHSPVKFGHTQPVRDPSDGANRRNPIRTADLNLQYFKYKTKPTWGFGTSGLGFRFMPGTAFSRQPPVQTNSRLRGFRELREDIPERSEKEYQDTLAKTLAEVTREVVGTGGEPTPIVVAQSAPAVDA